MIASGSMQHIYGEVLSRSAYTPEDQVPGIVRFLSQGAVAGPIMSFLVTVGAILLNPTNGYNLFFIFLLPFYLASSMVLSLLPSLLIWGCTRLAGHRLDPPARAGLGILMASMISIAVCYLIYLDRPPYLDRPELTAYLPVIAISAMMGMVLGLVVGSGLQPWRALVRGVDSLPAKARVLTGITGIALRVVVAWGLMEAIVAMICQLQREYRRDDFLLTAFTLAHFTLASIIVFARMRLSLLLPLALLADVPVALFIRKYYGTDDGYGLAIAAIVYLAVWATFLLSRWRATYAALTSLKDELRYYLID